MKQLFILALAIIAMSCSKSGVEKPANLIEEDVMAEIFYDLAIMDAIKSHRPLSLHKKNIVPDKYIYKKYGVDSLQFANSNRYYASDIERYKKIYNEVGQKLEAEAVKAKTVKPRKIKRLPGRENDSLPTIR